MSDKDQLHEILEQIRCFADDVIQPMVSPERWYVYSELRDLADAALNIVTKDRWIPVTERLPDPTPILGKNAVGAVIVQTCDMKAKHPHSRPLRYERRKVRGKLVERWTYMDFIIYHESITHWKPLSEPPKEAEDGR